MYVRTEDAVVVSPDVVLSVVDMMAEEESEDKYEMQAFEMSTANRCSSRITATRLYSERVFVP